MSTILSYNRVMMICIWNGCWMYVYSLPSSILFTVKLNWSNLNDETRKKGNCLILSTTKATARVGTRWSNELHAMVWTWRWKEEIAPGNFIFLQKVSFKHLDNWRTGIWGVRMLCCCSSQMNKKYVLSWKLSLC